MVLERSQDGADVLQRHMHFQSHLRLPGLCYRSLSFRALAGCQMPEHAVLSPFYSSDTSQSFTSRIAEFIEEACEIYAVFITLRLLSFTYCWCVMRSHGLAIAPSLIYHHFDTL